MPTQRKSGMIADGVDSSGIRRNLLVDANGALQTTPTSGAETIADGGDVAQGSTTDAPVADNTTVASGTSATGIALWKRLVNLGIAILAKLPPVNSSTATGVPTRFTNIGANATLNVKSSAGNVFSVVCSNANAAVRYLQLHNTATVPADQAVPVYSFMVQPASQQGWGTDIFTTSGVRFATGVAFAFSTTRDTYTAGTAADQSTVVHYA